MVCRRAAFGIIILAVIGFDCARVRGQQLDAAGVTLLREVTNLDGAGIRVAQPEALIDTNNDWEVGPASVSEPTNLFTWFTNGASSGMFPNPLGGESWHADDVGQVFYDPVTGMATNVAHVDNYEADDFYNDIIAARSPQNINDAIVNQSYTFGQVSASEQEEIDTNYDNYSMRYQTLFISAANNGGAVSPPGTSYDCISVGCYQGASSYGPTVDNGRCKPDITVLPPSWGTETSFSTPVASGAAALLMQAGLRGDGGANSSAASNMITIKALLLNGAVKPANWQNHPPEPLDTNYGAGVLNVFNSYEQLRGGKNGYISSIAALIGSAHPPVVTSATEPVLNGWDFNTNTSSALDDSVNHYLFNVTNGSSAAAFTLTATLAWNRHESTTGINNLWLFLYNAANSNLVACSTSVVDNVQHLFVPQLAQGRYDLQVWKTGGVVGEPGIVSDSETYALAWEMFSQFLTVTNAGTNVFLSWPIYPEGFEVAGTANLLSPAWSTNNIPPPTFTNGMNVIYLNPTNIVQFFRLQEPDL